MKNGGILMKIKTFEKKSILRGKINSKRIDMYKKANLFGFTHPLVVACSQELDSLLNQYQSGNMIK